MRGKFLNLWKNIGWKNVAVFNHYISRCSSKVQWATVFCVTPVQEHIASV